MVANIEMEDALLGCVQLIPGETPKKKFKYINVTAKEIAEGKSTLDSKNIAKPLQRLINVEVAKLQNKTDTLIESLRTSEALLCHRVLQIPDLFVDENSPLLNWNYFNDHLLSQVSFTTRCKLLKKVSTNLQKKDPKYAEQFYAGICESYDKKEALPFLFACSESFLTEQVTKQNIELNDKQLLKLLKKYPNFVTSYLDRFFNEPERDKRKCKIDKYALFLPNLLQDHFDSMISLYETWRVKKKNTNYLLKTQFGKRRTKLFLKKGRQLLINQPDLYLNRLTFSVVSAQLTDDEFVEMFAKMFPPKRKVYAVKKSSVIRPYYDDLSPERRLPIILKTFKKAYDKDLYDYPELIDEHVLELIPEDQRVKIARQKYEASDKDWNSPFRPFLAFDELFDEIKQDITKRSSHAERMRLIKQLFRNIEISYNSDHLLKLLKYISARHKNESANILSDMLDCLYSCNLTKKMSKEHWDIALDLVKRVDLADSLSNLKKLYRVIHEAITFKLKNNLDADDVIRLNLKISMDNYYRVLPYEVKEGKRRHVHMYVHYKYIRMYFDELRKIVISMCSDENVDAKLYVEHLINCFSRNNIYFIKQGLKERLINIEDYPELIELIETRFHPEREDNEGSFYRNLKEYVSKFNPKLYKKWNLKKDKVTCIEKKTIHDLKQNYKEILADWETYLSMCTGNLRNKCIILFLKKLRWYNNLSKNFIDALMKQLEEDNLSSLKLLAILLDGRKYQKLIEPYIPVNPELDLENIDNVNTKEKIDNCLAGVRFVKPPLELKVIERLFTSDYLKIVKQAVFISAHNIPTPAVLEFILSHINSRVAIAKLMMDLLFVVASMNDKLKMYYSILETNKHVSIFGVIMRKAWKLFNKEKTERFWCFVEKCLDTKLIEDEKILRQLTTLKSVPEEHVASYVVKVFRIVENVQLDGFPNLSSDLMLSIMQQLDKKFAQLLSEEFQRDLLQKYLFDPLMKNEDPLLPTDFLFNVYLNHEDAEQRMTFVSNNLVKVVNAQFGKPAKRPQSDEDFYPVNAFIRSIVDQYVSLVALKKGHLFVINILQGLFNTMIKPWQDVRTFLFLIWIKDFVEDGYNFEQFGIRFGENMHVWINLFGPEYFSKISIWVKRFIGLCEPDDPYVDYSTDFVRGLIQVKNHNSYVCTASFLHNLNRDSGTYSDIIEELKKVDIPTVHALLYEHIYRI